MFFLLETIFPHYILMEVYLSSFTPFLLTHPGWPVLVPYFIAIVIVPEADSVNHGLLWD